MRTIDVNTERGRSYENFNTKIYHTKFFLCSMLLFQSYALLLNDVLVLLERYDKKFHLQCHTAETMSGNKEEYSPVIRVQEYLQRHAAHDRGWSI